MKVLIISHNCFSTVYNNGKTLESIFSAFPKESLAQIYFTDNMTPDYDYCNNYFKITDRNIIKSILKFKSNCGEVLEQDSSNNINTKNNKSSKLFLFAKSKTDYLVFFRDMLWGSNLWKSKSLLNWCDKLKPDLIFFVGGYSGFSHKISWYLQKRLKVPLVTYFTDDYIIYPKRKNILDFLQKYRMRKIYFETIKRSSLCFAIGSDMAREYSTFFGKQFFVIMNSISIRDYNSYYFKPKVTISYFGGLHLNRWKMLLRLSKLLSNISINVYSPDILKEDILKEFISSGISFKGIVEGDTLINKIEESDILLHIESDDQYFKLLTKLSISTKIPEYLIAGRVILGFGPEDSSSMKLLTDNNIGYFISSSLSDNEIAIKLNILLNDYSLRKKIGYNGYVYAINNFDNKAIAENFKNKLKNLVLCK